MGFNKGKLLIVLVVLLFIFSIVYAQEATTTKGSTLSDAGTYLVAYSGDTSTTKDTTTTSDTTTATTDTTTTGTDTTTATTDTTTTGTDTTTDTGTTEPGSFDLVFDTGTTATETGGTPEGDVVTGGGDAGRSGGRRSCSDLGGIICSGECAPGSSEVGARESNCCVPPSCASSVYTPEGIFVVMDQCLDRDRDGISEHIEFVCEQVHAVSVEECYNNIINNDQEELLGVEGLRPIGYCESSSFESPWFGIGALILAFIVLVVFYLLRLYKTKSRKALKKRR